MKILIIGGGSIGQRHAQNALELAGEVALYDTDQSISSAFSQKHGTRIFETLDQAWGWKPDATVIASPHTTHIELATKAIKSKSIPLIEKPISHTAEGIDDFLQISKINNIPAYVVCNMRFHPAIQSLKDNIHKVGNVLYARAQYGNYLPNMRPDADYKKLYCANKSQGGGVILDAIHEVNYLSWLFGEIETVTCEADKRSNLDIDVEDYAAMTLKHINGIRSEIHLDYLQQFKRRSCEIVGDKGTLIWQSEGKQPEHCTVRLYTSDAQEWQTIYENQDVDAQTMYKDMMKMFLQSIQTSNPTPDLLTASGAYNDLKVCHAAHKSAQSGQRQNIE